MCHLFTGTGTHTHTHTHTHSHTRTQTHTDAHRQPHLLLLTFTLNTSSPLPPHHTAAIEHLTDLAECFIASVGFSAQGFAEARNRAEANYQDIARGLSHVGYGVYEKTKIIMKITTIIMKHVSICIMFYVAVAAFTCTHTHTHT